MTDFQMSLIAAGGIFVVGVISYNKWQEYKARKSVERAFSTDHDDVLMKSGAAPAAPVEPSFDEPAPAPRQEPVLDANVDAPFAELAGADALAEPVVREPAPAHPSAPPAVHAAAPAAGSAAAALDPLAGLPGAKPDTPPAELAENLVDPLIDCLIPLNIEGALRGDKILPALLKLRRVGNKPVHFVGLAVNGDWEPIVHGGVYTRLQAGVQLATRSTALNELEYSEMVTRLRAVADEIAAEPEVPDMIEVMSEAKNLHRFVAGHDAQLGVNLASKGAPWAMSTLIGALENQGFDVRPDGRFAMLDKEDGPAGGVLFTLSTNVNLGADTTSRLTLLLDVPCVAPAKDGFGKMVACAKSLELRLDAAIVDDFDQPLSDEALGEIAGQVGEFYQEMEAADIPAGSTRALRLFS
ncbi:cell division protein ZipA C-terminal FtsZ-binding domain-containing protein [Massilia sp. WG5]|uniref:cell division protein ZipA C-terminal FtsZ-binding domain-containing protein n=1 Tax=Massilia sp. WG5 TaxID=1707785 RepID=UPI000706E24A|nr:cell division protein ZipA C-terminal FtsZ-binding domain-containing protein [Massilia sp. WG5]ALK97758.1 cell division protein [Massilia sp. WG5]